MDSHGYFVPTALVFRSRPALACYMVLLREGCPLNRTNLRIDTGLTDDEVDLALAELANFNLVNLNDDEAWVLSSGRLMFTGFVPVPSKNKRKKKKEGDLEGECEGKPLPLFDAVVALYHEMLPELPSVAVLSNTRRAAFRQRASTPIAAPDGTPLDPSTLDFWREFFGVVKRSDFLMGRKQGDRKWAASFDFLLSTKGFSGVVEGKYENR